MIDVLEIQEKQKAFRLGVASPDDFACCEIGKADPSLLVEDPTISLYCLDDSARRALFVQVPEDVDITAGAFLYLEQYDHAQRILSVPYEVLHRLAADIALSAPLVFIYSTGRAGSTLLSKAFGEMESVTSLSEPDVYTQAVAMRLSGGPDDDIRDLLTSATKLLFNPTFTHSSSLNVVKFRSFCIQLADLMSAAFPDAGNLFLYRDLYANIISGARAFGVGDRPPDQGRGLAVYLATMMPLLAEELKWRTDLDGIEVLCFIWLSAMHAYAQLQQQGLPILAMRYEELIADPPNMLGTILTYLGMPSERIQSGLRAFERDSQAGSPLSQEEAAHRTVRIDEHRWDLIRNLLQRYPIAGADIPAASLAVP